MVIQRYEIGRKLLSIRRTVANDASENNGKARYLNSERELPTILHGNAKQALGRFTFAIDHGLCLQRSNG